MFIGTGRVLARQHYLASAPEGILFFMPQRQPLSHAYAAARPAGEVEPSDELETELLGLVASARRAWPQLALDELRFVHVLATHALAGEAPSSLYTDDLYLATACLAHHPSALAAFDTQYLKPLRLRVAHLKLGTAQLDDLEQQLRSELLVAPSGTLPKLAQYRGQGELAGWLRVAAVRAGLRLLPRNDEDEGALEGVATRAADPELAYMKEADRSVFRAAFHEALSALPADQQNVLRQHYIDGLSIDDLGELHAAHRTSAARWLREAREALLQGTKSILTKQHRVSPSECDSIIRAAQSQLEITMRSLLR
jgi:RNA polymerase sigma-70 factor, ECF subfamily